MHNDDTSYATHDFDDNNNAPNFTLTPEQVQWLHALQQRNRDKRRHYTKLLIEGKMSLDAIVTLAHDKKNQTLRKLRIAPLLAQCPGWDLPTASHALSSRGMRADITIGRLYGHPTRIDMVGQLFTGSPQEFARRHQAPQGWPWRGGIYHVLRTMDIDTLPTELQRSVRWLYEAEPALREKEGKEPVEPQEDIDEFYDHHVRNTIVDGDRVRDAQEGMAAREKERQERKKQREQEQSGDDQSDNGNVLDERLRRLLGGDDGWDDDVDDVEEDGDDELPQSLRDILGI